MPMLNKLFQKIEKGIFTKSCNKSSIKLVQKLDTYITRKEKYCLILLMIIDTKTLTKKRLANEVQNGLKRTIYYIKRFFSLRRQGYFNLRKLTNEIYCINWIKKKGYQLISQNAEKVLDRIFIPLHDKPQKSKKKMQLPKPGRGHR